MKPLYSARTIREHLPTLNSIYACFELDVQRYPQLDDQEYLRVIQLEEEYNLPKLGYAMAVLDNWLQGSDFGVQRHFFVYKKDGAHWDDFLKIFDAKMLEYQNERPIIVLTLSKSGRITRNMEGTLFHHDFEKGQKLLLLQYLVAQEDSNYVPTGEIQKVVGAKTTAVASKAVESIRTILELKLKLPPTKPIIDNKRGSGYRLDPMYNVVFVD
jgi:hypothetical protein